MTTSPDPTRCSRCGTPYSKTNPHAGNHVGACCRFGRKPKASHESRNDGPQATVAKLEDARTLLTTIRRQLDEEFLARTNDLNGPGPGWRHFGDAARLLERLKDLGELLGIDRNELATGQGCPMCGTRDTDRLLIDEQEVRCTCCGCNYELD